VPEEFRTTVASRTALPLNSSLMVTVPLVIGVPPAVTLTVRGCVHPLRVPADNAVAVDTPEDSASAGTASAIINPATNISREPRQFMPLTCTCSKNQNRVPPTLRSTEPYCIRRGRAGANRQTAIYSKMQKISPELPVQWLDAA